MSEIGINLNANLDVFPNQSAQELFYFTHERVYIENFHRNLLTPRKSEQLAGQVSGAIYSQTGVIEQRQDLVSGGKFFGCQLHVALNGCQQVIEIVGDAAS